jgi:hypothetical protein
LAMGCNLLVHLYAKPGLCRCAWASNDPFLQPRRATRLPARAGPGRRAIGRSVKCARRAGAVGGRTHPVPCAKCTPCMPPAASTVYGPLPLFAPALAKTGQETHPNPHQWHAAERQRKGSKNKSTIQRELLAKRELLAEGMLATEITDQEIARLGELTTLLCPCDEDGKQITGKSVNAYYGVFVCESSPPKSFPSSNGGDWTEGLKSG